MTFQYTNNAVGQLSTSILSGTTTIVLNPGQGGAFPTLTGTNTFMVTLVSASNPAILEICLATARTGDTITIVRGQEGTTPLSFAAGDIVSERLTAGQITLLTDQTYVGHNVGQVVTSIANLRLLNHTVVTYAQAAGYYTAGDGGGGNYYYDPADTTSSDNGGTIIVDSGGGRWKLITGTKISVKQFGAKGNAVADDTTFIQAALSFCATTGDTLYIPAGVYVTTAAISVSTDNGQSFNVNGGRKISVVGEGTANTTILYTGSSTITVLTFSATVSGNNYLELSGFRVQRPDSNVMHSTGIIVTGMVDIALRDLVFFRLGVGLTINDCNVVLVDKCSVLYNNVGILGQYTSISPPNLIRFNNCNFSANVNQGVILNGGVVNSFYGCDFEQNGQAQGVETATAVAIQVTTNTPLNTRFFPAVNLYGCYFEGNGGAADLYCSFNGEANVTIVGTLFNRTNNTVAVTNNIVFDAAALTSAYGAIAIEMSGNGFTSQGTYTPAAGNRTINYLHGSGGYKQFFINDNNSYQNTVDLPIVDGQIDRLRGDTSKAWAFGKISGAAGAIISNYQIATSVRNSTGNYTITLNGGAIATLIPIITVVGSGEVMYYISAITTTSFTVQFNNTAAAPIDTNFNFVVFAGF